MQPLAANDVLQLVFEGTNETVPWAWVSHWMVDAAEAPQTFLDGLIDYIVQEFWTNAAPILTDQWRVECVSVGRVAPQPMNIYFSTADLPVVGEVTTDGIPNTSAVVVRFTSEEPGARNRGRMYLCGLPEAATNGGLLGATDRTALQNLYAGLIEPYNSGLDAGHMVIFSRTAYNPAADPPQAPGVYTADVTDVSVQYNLGTIRRRRRPRSVAP